MKLNKEFNYIKKWEEKYDTITSFGETIYSGKIDMNEAKMDQTNLLKNWKEFCEKSKPRTKKKIEIKNEMLLIV